MFKKELFISERRKISELLFAPCQIKALWVSTIWADWRQTMAIGAKAPSICRLLSMWNTTRAMVIQSRFVLCKTIFLSAWTARNWARFAMNRSKVKNATILPSNALATGVGIFATTPIATCFFSILKQQKRQSPLIKTNKTCWRSHFI